jgi:hypothetical protein
MLPKTMQFTAAASTGFKLINYPNEPDAVVQVASNTTPGQNLSFKVTGEGVLQASQEGNAPNGDAGDKANNRPGGGLGPPIDAPDPLQKYRWQILGGIAAALIVGGVYVALRQQSAARALVRQKTASTLPAAVHFDEDEYGPAPALATPAVRPTPAARPNSMLLDALKEELFQLEVERRQGQISPAEYEKAKSALDQTLDRALKREAQRA